MPEFISAFLFVTSLTTFSFTDCFDPMNQDTKLKLVSVATSLLDDFKLVSSPILKVDCAEFETSILSWEKTFAVNAKNIITKVEVNLDILNIAVGYLGYLILSRVTQY